MVSREIIFLGAHTVDIDTSISCNNHLNYFHGDVGIHVPLSSNNFSKNNDRHCTHNITLRLVRVTIVAMEKQTITYSECVPVALFIRYAQSMYRVMSSSVTCPAVPYFSALSHKWHEFRNKIYWIWNVWISMFHRAFFNSIIDKHQHMHFFTFNTILIYNVDFDVKIHKIT